MIIVYAVLSTAVLVTDKTSSNSSPASIFGRASLFSVPAKIALPVSSDEKKVESTIVITRTSFYCPIDTARGFSNATLKCMFSLVTSVLATTKFKFS